MGLKLEREHSIKTKLFFNKQQLHEKIAHLANIHKANKTALRKGVLEHLKELCNETWNFAEQDLLRSGKGHICAQNLSLFQDELIASIYQLTIRHIYPADNPSSGEHLSILATGGYGRGLLAPQSDIDLMFLFPFKQTAWGESVVEYILYLLWDLGFKLGHATRTIDQAIRLSQSDFTIRTALLDARFITGDQTVFDEFYDRYEKEVMKGSENKFIDAKLNERDERHEQAGKSRYRVEPNIKDGKGGLRDLHTLYWIGKYVTESEGAKDFVEAGIFSPSEYRQFVRCENFLWTVRCHLHFMTGRPEEKLTFDLQQDIADRLRYKQHTGLRAVERFMRHYFLVAKKVGTLTRVVCASIELKQHLTQAKRKPFLTLFGIAKENNFEIEGYKLETGRLMVSNRNTFRKNPVELIRLFYIAEQQKLNFHPEVLRLVHASHNLIDETLRNTPEANQFFLELLCSPTNSEKALRSMNEAGVLGRFIPDFGKVVSMMQFNMYHHYTVDEHLIRSVGILNEIEMGQSKDEHPIASKVFNTISNRRALYVAMFLHDIAKGRKEDHSVAGAKSARLLCPRLGLTQTETDLVAWLVENHLVMSMFAQNRDLQDPKTISDFSDIVKTRERLNLLLILTVADIRAVGPGVWNGWKRQLLQSLYFSTKHALSEDETDTSYEDQIEIAKHKLRHQLTEWTEPEFARFTQNHYPEYWLRTDEQDILKHARMVKSSQGSKDILSFDINTKTDADVTEITLYTLNRPKLVVQITAACVLADANIIEAQIYTTRDRYALDTISIRRAFDMEEDEQRRAIRIIKTLKKFTNNQQTLQDTPIKTKQPTGRKTAFSIEPSVNVDNSLSDNFSVIEIRNLDRPGLLFHITQRLNELYLDISSAHISTFGEQAVDTFYVTDMEGNKLQEKSRINDIQKQITEYLHMLLPYK
ncbi:MAG: [protein-PII] uridylyltransferase [Pseudomonadota bacterium]